MRKPKVNIEPIILHYLQKDISEEDMRTLMEWIREKEENKILFFQVKEVFELRRNGLYPSEEEVSASRERLFAKIGNTDKYQRTDSKTKVFWISFGRYVAVAIISMCFILGVQHVFEKEETVVYSELHMEAGPRMAYMTLPDGTEVILNASTILRFPNKFEEKHRVVYLDGEARFNVKKNAGSPFIVHTDKHQIRVLGTKFNVMDYSTDDYAITTLIDGEILLETINENGEMDNPIVMKPSQQVFFNTEDKAPVISDVQIEESKIWINKVFYFKDEPLSHIMSRLEKLYGINIRVLNKNLEDIRFTGTFRLGQNLDEVLHIINFEKQFIYKITDNEVIIK